MRLIEELKSVPENGRVIGWSQLILGTEFLEQLPTLCIPTFLLSFARVEVLKLRAQSQVSLVQRVSMSVESLDESFLGDHENFKLVNLLLH